MENTIHVPNHQPDDIHLQPGRLVERLQFFHQANSGTLDAGPLRAPPNSMAIGIWAVKTWHMWHMVYGHHGHPTECGLVPNGLMTIPQSGYIYI